MASVKIDGVYWEHDAKSSQPGLARLMLNIILSNDQTFWLSLKSKASDPRFARMWDAPTLQKPRTDGCCVYWQDGPSLCFNEIMEMLVG